MDNTEFIPPCRGKTELFFAIPAERPQARERREAAAKQICSTCDIRVECLEAAKVNIEYGIWGGTNEDDRSKMNYNVPRSGLTRQRKIEIRKSKIS